MRLPSLNRNGVISVVIFICLANTLIRPITSAISDQGIWGAIINSFGVNTAVRFAIGMIVINLQKASIEVPNKNDHLIISIIMLGIVIPSTTISWLCLAGFAGWLFKTSQTTYLRTTSAILLVLSLRDPLLSNVSNLFNTEILAIDTFLVSMTLSVVDASIYQRSNLIMGDDGVKLVILKGCSSLTNLSYAFLIWYSITKTYTTQITKQAWLALFIILSGIFACNMLRLTLMATSETNYHLLHNATSNSLQSVLMLFTVLFLSFWGAKCFIPRG